MLFVLTRLRPRPSTAPSHPASPAQPAACSAQRAKVGLSNVSETGLRPTAPSAQSDTGLKTGLRPPATCHPASASVSETGLAHPATRPSTAQPSPPKFLVRLPATHGFAALWLRLASGPAQPATQHLRAATRPAPAPSPRHWPQANDQSHVSETSLSQSGCPDWPQAQPSQQLATQLRPKCMKQALPIQQPAHSPAVVRLPGSQQPSPGPGASQACQPPAPSPLAGSSQLGLRPTRV